MSGPVHFDIDRLRRDYLAANTAALADARARAKTPEAHLGIDLQERMLPLLIEATCIACQARNDGFSELVIGKALGHVLGNVSGNYIANAMRNGKWEASFAHVDALQLMMAAGTSGDTKISGMTTASVQHAPVVGGHG